MNKLLIIILLAFTGAVFGQTGETALIKTEEKNSVSSEAKDALKDFDFNRLTINPNNLTEKNIENLRENFLAAVKPHLLDKGKEVNRLARIAQPIFVFHKAHKSRTIIFDHKLPTVFTWKETFVTFSTGAMNILTDEEISLLIAHELGHLYFAEDLGKARIDKNDRLTRVIELKCDLVALITSTKLNIKPHNLISAVKKLIQSRSQFQINNSEPGSPSIKSREEILDAFLSMQKL